MVLYMPQDLFNQTAMAIAAMQWINRNDAGLHRGISKKLNDSLQVYLDYYTDDDFLPEAQECAEDILNWVRKEFEHNNDNTGSILAVRTEFKNPDDTTLLMVAMYEAVLSYKPNGKRKPPWPISGLGLWFTSARSPVENRKDQCLKDLALYYFNVVGPAAIGRVSPRLPSAG